MSVLLWIAVLIGVWCIASVITALAMGTYVRRCREATDPNGALRPLDVGSPGLWTGGFADIPDTPAEAFGDVPVPRAAVHDLTGAESLRP